MDLTDRLARGLKATLIARVVDLVANGLLLIVLARYVLAPAEYGLLYLALNVAGVLAIAGSLGLPASSARFVAEFEETNPGQVPHVLRRSARYALALALTVALATVLFHRQVADLVGEAALAPLLLIGAGYVVARAGTQYCINVFQGFNRVTWSALVRSVRVGAVALLAIGLAAGGLGVTGAMLGYVGGYAIAAAIGATLLVLGYYRGYDADPEPESDLDRRLLEYGVPLTATRGAAMLDKKIDTVLVGALLNPLAVAYYSIAKQVSSVSIAVASSLGFTISPTVGEQTYAERPGRAAELYESALESILLLYIPGAVGLVLVAEPLVIHVFGDGYRGAVLVLQVFAGYVLVNSLTQVTSDGLDYLGRARDRAIVKTVAAVANVVLNLALIPVIGVAGAALATVITHTFYAGANLYVMHTELPISLRSVAGSVAWVVPITAAMALAVFALRPFVSGIPSLLAVVGSGALIWALLSVAGGLIDPRRVRSFLL